MAEDNIILRAVRISKLYGPNKTEAARLLESGMGKEEVYRKTGCTAALWDVTLDVPRGKIFVIIGLSGSGKSTIVRCFNRLLTPTSGKILFEGQDIAMMDRKTLLQLRRGNVSMVFQSFGLMSHRDVLGNVVYGLEIRGVAREERERKAKEVLSLVGLTGQEHQRCDQLSGGMRQRVGIARALATDPDVLLMDEPFSALDPLVRRDMQFELLQIQRKLEKTVVFITHDIDEAFKLGDTVAIMRDGRLIQVDTPEQMSQRPADDYVKEFIDSADKTKVTSVQSIMITPALTRIDESLAFAIKEMRKNSLSTVYVVGDRLQLMGILTIQDAIRAQQQGGGSIREIMRTDVQTVLPDATVADIIPGIAESPWPIAVIDEARQLKGIITKASVLSSLV